MHIDKLYSILKNFCGIVINKNRYVSNELTIKLFTY